MLVETKTYLTPLLYKKRPCGQLLKWVGNKYRFAEYIVKLFPIKYNRYLEPFVGTGAVLGTFSPKQGIAGDSLKPLIDFWNLVKDNPLKLIKSYHYDISRYNKNRKEVYYEIRDRFNANHNPSDLLFLSRTCYGGVMRFRKVDGFMSTPMGVHKPIPPHSFEKRLRDWRKRIINTSFFLQDYKETLSLVEENDIIYCDPPYIDSQKILYGAQSFKLKDLFEEIIQAKENGAYVALSIDGSKKSKKELIDIKLPPDLFERELLIDCGSSMLRRFQMNGENMSSEMVKDRLLLTW